MDYKETNIRENFINDSKSNEIIKNVFIGIAIMFLSLILGGLFGWAYMYGIYMFVTTLLFVFLIYAIINMSYVLINKKNLDETTFNIQFGSAIYVIFLSFFAILYFGFKAYRTRSYGSYGQQPVYQDRYYR